jgi:hypothetical protein
MSPVNTKYTKYTKRDYYYINIGEDDGLISAIMLNASFIKII